jgi:hypothetical protein
VTSMVLVSHSGHSGISAVLGWGRERERANGTSYVGEEIRTPEKEKDFENPAPHLPARHGPGLLALRTRRRHGAVARRGPAKCGTSTPQDRIAHFSSSCGCFKRTDGYQDDVKTFTAIRHDFTSLFVVLGFELRAYTLNHSTAPFLCWVFRDRVFELFAGAGFEL